MSLNKKSKFLSLLLRHKPDALGLTMDAQGYVEVQQIIDNSRSGKYPCNPFSFDDIKEIVFTDEKSRYSFENADMNYVRANQGHSIDVDLEMQSLTPPTYLYHGTSKKAIEFIKVEGIKPMSRNHVHLSLDTNTAEDVGGRGKRGVPIILRIRAYDLWKTGVKFYLSSNGVWLTEDIIPFNFAEIYYAA
jgi:putative RNA 2'-phosphotransferase